MSTATVVAVDSGQSGIRARAARDGQTLLELELPGMRTDLDVVDQLAGVVGAVAGRHVVPEVLALGSTGLTETDTAARLLSLVRKHGVREVYLAHDSITSYAGALGADPGAICATGTGTVTLAVGATDTARVDGWGWLMGDIGSGFWIGRAGLDAAMRAYDGRGPATGMLDLVEREFSSVEGAYIEIQADAARVARVASYARRVLDLAAEGDGPCQEIAVRAGQALALSVATALRRVQHLDAPQVVGMGGIFRSAEITQAFTEHLARLVPGARVVEPRGTSLDGAAELPLLPDEHPLLARVDVAR